MSTVTDEKPAVEIKMIPVYIMGKKYEVPAELTIMKAIEYAGYKYIRGCGCRGGICGACATVYRKPGDYKIYTGLACQTVVEPNMYLTQLPFYPAIRATYDFSELHGEAEEVHALYPEVFRCVACNACTKVCPMDVEVMDYIAAIKRGDLKAAAEISFDCIQCGLCASRCMGELPQYHIAQLVRRINGAYLTPKAEHLQTMVANIEAGRYVKVLQELKAMDVETLKKTYTERELEPATAGDDWTPQSNKGL
ncbi:MAG TPA: 4Fe-4S dicluster domain-containing protein [candidate division Zixibacteria bacterium]|nr:4Fe-4S dicluster domain-containing protein [candidate division Zixibacteria bacterium]